MSVDWRTAQIEDVDMGWSGVADVFVVIEYIDDNFLYTQDILAPFEKAGLL